MKDLTTTVFFDMRAPDFGTPTHELYGAALEMAALADEIRVDRIGLMEHHGSDDGYLPQPFTLVGGMAAVTKNIRFILGAVLLPLHDPVHFKGLTDPKVLRQAGLFAAWTPDELIAHVPSLPDKGNFGFQPLLGGLSPEEGWKSLELLKNAMPRLKAAIAATE